MDQRQFGQRAMWYHSIAVVYVAFLFIILGSECQAATLSLKQIGGRFIARGELVHADRAVPAHMIIDLGTPIPLLIHENTSKVLKVDKGSPVALRFSEFTLSDISCTPAGIELLEEITRDYAEELEEIPVVAVVGLPAFAGHTVELNTRNLSLSLLSRPLDAILTDPELELNSAWKSGKSWVIPFESQSNGYWMTGHAGEDFELKIRFSTAVVDTLIDQVTADLAGAPGGDLDTLTLGDLEITDYIALRPEDLTAMLSTPCDVILGANLMDHFRITIDYDHNKMWFLETLEPNFPTAEQAFFVARYEENANGVEQFVTEHPHSRLAQEAAQILYRLRLAEFPLDPKTVIHAVRLYAATVKPGLRARRLIELADELYNNDSNDLADVGRMVLDMALDSAPDDVNALAEYQIRARLGRLAVMQKDFLQARRYLLSAVFGMPQDPFVNYWLGVLYEKTEKCNRAWSRYLQAAIAKDAPPEAAQALGRLNNDAVFREQFTMRDAEQLLEGRIPEYHPATRYDDDKSLVDEKPVRLIEMFTCVDQPMTQVAELAFSGLREYFTDQTVVLIGYHLPVPSPDPLVCPAALARGEFYQVTDTATILFDGNDAQSPAGDETMAEQVFGVLKRAALKSQPISETWQLSGGIDHRDGIITGQVKVQGPAATDGRLWVLVCEKIIMVSGGNGILLHRNVCRTSLTDPNGLTLPRDGSVLAFPIELDMENLNKIISDQIAGQEETQGVRFYTRPTYIDPAELVIVAIVQNPDNKADLSVLSLELNQE